MLFAETFFQRSQNVHHICLRCTYTPWGCIDSRLPNLRLKYAAGFPLVFQGGKPCNLHGFYPDVPRFPAGNTDGFLGQILIKTYVDFQKWISL